MEKYFGEGVIQLIIINFNIDQLIIQKNL